MRGKHTVYLEWGELRYWKDNSAAGSDDDDWNRCEVIVWAQTVAIVTNKNDLNRYCVAFMHAYVLGKRARSTEFAKLIGDQ